MPEQVTIKDLADPDGVVRDRTFEDCEIVGPVALVPLGSDNEVTDCDYPVAPEYMAQARIGPSWGDIVLLSGCSFRRCRFALDVDASRLQPS